MLDLLPSFDYTKNVYDTVEWKTVNVSIKNKDGESVFERKGCRFPDFYSETACNIIASKYFTIDETSMDQIINRVVNRIVLDWGKKQGYAKVLKKIGLTLDQYAYQLKWLLLNQYMSFNSPVWFNVGNEYRNGLEQASACFISSVEDTIPDIMELCKTEGLIFKQGSGNGVNLSKLRSKYESVSGGGKASGVVSWMRIHDAVAGSTKSGGTCLSGNQPVYTDKGSVEIKDLVDKEFVVLNYDFNKKRYCARKATAFKVGTKDIYKLTTDKGVFELTGNHPVLLKDRRYVELSTLIPGMSLYSISVSLDGGGRPRINLHDSRRTKRQVHRLIGEDVLGATNSDHVHHIDFDILNNSLDNLAILDKIEHIALHNKYSIETGANAIIKGNELGLFSHAGKNNGMHRDSKFYKNEEKLRRYKNKQSSILKNSGRARSMQKDAVKTKVMNNAYRLINKGYDISTLDNYFRARIAESKYKESHYLSLIADQVKGWIDRIFNGSYDDFYSELRLNNHKVVSLEFLRTDDVFDVEVIGVEDYNSQNFVIMPIGSAGSQVGNGITVHNSRRAAKLVSLNTDHGDIEDFIDCKSKEEKKARALLAAGYPIDFEDPDSAYNSVFFQNSNNSVRTMLGFMQCVKHNESYYTLERYSGKQTSEALRVSGVTRQGKILSDPTGKVRCVGTDLGTFKVIKEYKARELFRSISGHAWESGDPALIFDEIVNSMNPMKERINCANPCVEYHFLDDTSCNLLSMNLIKCYLPNGSVNYDLIEFMSVRAIIAQDILVDNAHYPTEKISAKTKAHRALGLGYGNLGGLLMKMHIPYGSQKSLKVIGNITDEMNVSALETSLLIGNTLGAFSEIGNAIHYERILGEYKSRSIGNKDRYEAIIANWRNLRNAQVTLLAPCGTIGFAMDMDTTGVEPLIALISFKKTVDGGYIKMAPPIVTKTLTSLGYDAESVMNEYADSGKLNISDEHKAIFKTALDPDFMVTVDNHLNVMAAAQKFLSGAISKTVNLPNSATVEDIEEVYFRAYNLGLKAIALYRDGCKAIQPVNVKKDSDSKEEKEPIPQILHTDHRKKMPVTRNAKIHKFSIAGTEGYLIAGEYEDGSLGELFIKINKEGSTVSGLTEALALTFSIAIQSGADIETLLSKYEHTRFEPAGYTDNPSIRYATSILDYISKWIKLSYSKDKVNLQSAAISVGDSITTISEAEIKKDSFDGPPCSNCGGITQKSGTCYYCQTCGSSTGCS